MFILFLLFLTSQAAVCNSSAIETPTSTPQSYYSIGNNNDKFSHIYSSAYSNSGHYFLSQWFEPGVEYCFCTKSDPTTLAVQWSVTLGNVSCQMVAVWPAGNGLLAIGGFQLYQLNTATGFILASSKFSATFSYSNVKVLNMRAALFGWTGYYQKLNLPSFTVQASGFKAAPNLITDGVFINETHLALKLDTGIILTVDDSGVQGWQVRQTTLGGTFEIEYSANKVYWITSDSGTEIQIGAVDSINGNSLF